MCLESKFSSLLILHYMNKLNFSFFAVVDHSQLSCVHIPWSGNMVKAIEIKELQLQHSNECVFLSQRLPWQNRVSEFHHQNETTELFGH